METTTKAAAGGPVAVGRAHSGSESGRATLDEATIEQIYRLHGQTILRTVLRASGGDLGRAEDVVQETLLRAWQHPECVARGVENALPWLLTVARRIAIDHFRMRAARPEEVCDETSLATAAVPDEADRVLAAYDVAAALAELHPWHRDVMVHLHVHDQSMAQAAEALGLPLGTVKSRTFHAVRALRPVLEARGMLATRRRGADGAHRAHRPIAQTATARAA